MPTNVYENIYTGLSENDEFAVSRWNWIQAWKQTILIEHSISIIDLH